MLFILIYNFFLFVDISSKWFLFVVYIFLLKFNIQIWFSFVGVVVLTNLLLFYSECLYNLSIIDFCAGVRYCEDLGRTFYGGVSIVLPFALLL